MEKNDEAQKIARLMCDSGIGIADIAKALKKIPTYEQFDYALQTKDVVIRIPFGEKSLEKYSKDIIGIFPFKDDERYLEVVEYDATAKVSKKTREEMLPTIDDFYRFEEILPILNSALRLTGASELKGSYHAGVAYGNVRSNYPEYKVVMPCGKEKMQVEAATYKGFRAKVRRYMPRKT